MSAFHALTSNPYQGLIPALEPSLVHTCYSVVQHPPLILLVQSRVALIRHQTEENKLNLGDYLHLSNKKTKMFRLPLQNVFLLSVVMSTTQKRKPIGFQHKVSLSAGITGEAGSPWTY